MIIRIILVNLVIPFVILLCNGYCFFECPFDKKCLRLSAMCNGTKECSFGEDELHVNCKYPITTRRSTFYCANGVPIDKSQMCNKKIDCLDKSDESPAICKQEYEIQLNLRIENSTCKKPQLACQASTEEDCISADKICDDKFDCPNGRDESIEMCMQVLRHPYFQCGNGKIIYNSSQLCDNKYDCLDGSDELETHCQYNEKWERKQPVTCEEPKRNNIKFTSNTTMYAEKENNETHYFVYAGGVVQFECYDSKEDFKGKKWNVCKIDENGNGKWLNDLPECVDNRNKNQNTNGDWGCRLDTYDHYSENLRIWNCSNDGENCVEKIKPPLTNANVKFNCSKNLMLFPEGLREKMYRCRDKEWKLNSKELPPKPRCGKMCSTSELYCLDSMEPKCKKRDGTTTKCDQAPSWEPETTVTYDCFPEYKESNSKFTSKCLNNGNWNHSGNRDEYCSIKCGVNDQEALLALNAPETEPHLSPWSVAIYDNNNTQQFQYSCGGVLIRHNFVLTAAHCVSDEKNNFGTNRIRVMPAQKVNVSVIDSHNDCRKANETNKDEADKHSECWIVQQIFINPIYDPTRYTSDSALLHLQANPFLPFRIVCIPGIHFDWEKGYTNRNGSVFAWDSGKRKSDKKLNFVYVDGILNIADNIANSNFHIDVTSYNVKTTLCKGDSGCGFFDYCPNGKKMCLFGIISTGQSMDINECTSNVKINSVVHPSTVAFVNKFIKAISNKCPK
ncbi:modular serine protease-like [Drosophila nasuta]|uniref:modular serine protease-like n=1 Tax=Drosophila nasuta TaxID=42062 RepID=UPI00295E911E|nr:modular serine protease-like [Drosophila nasuta]